MTGMTIAPPCRTQGDKAARVDPDGRSRTFIEVNRNANRLVRLLRGAGLKAGDAVAVVLSNRGEFIELRAAAMRGGFRLTPVNWHLNADEIAYILNDCEAQAVFGEPRIAAFPAAMAQAPSVKLKVAVGGGIRASSTTTRRWPLDLHDIADPVLGNQMLYTSGTTGRPKGVYRAAPTVAPPGMYALRG